MNPIRSLALTALLFSGLLAALAVGPLGYWRGHTDFNVWLSPSGQALVAGAAYLAAKDLPHPQGVLTRVGGLHITASVMLVMLARQLVRLVFGRSPGVTLASGDIHARSLVDNLSIAVRAPIRPSVRETVLRGHVSNLVRANGHDRMPSAAASNASGSTSWSTNGWWS